MNNFLTDFTGGMPRALDDLKFMQESYKEAFAGFLSHFGLTAQDSFVLSGCEITDGGANWDVAEGYISLEGEVLKVESHSIIKDALNTFYWTTELTFDPNGLKTFADSSSNNTYQIRKSVVVSALTPPATYLEAINLVTSAQADRLSDKLILTSGIKHTATDPSLKYKIVNIGSWTPQSGTASELIQITHGLNVSQIRSITGIIYSDTGTQAIAAFGTLAQNTGAMDPLFQITTLTNSTLELLAFVSGTNWDDPAINRGYLTILYDENA
jgi:hypothetical protein